jgi:ketosteroid isomerase-like protein
VQKRNLAFARRLWAAVNDGGLEAALKLTEPDVEWMPHLAGGRVLRSDELLAFFDEFRDDRQLLEATPYSFEAHDDKVLASGSFRLYGAGGHIAELQIHFVYEFEQGRLVRASTFDTRSDALRSIGLTC